MSEWKEYKLGDLLKIKYGKDHKKLGDGDIPIYGSGGIMRTGNAYLSDKPSVLIPRKGTLSNIFYVEEPFWTVDTMFWSEINDSIVIPKYLYYAIKDYKWDSLNVGSAVPSLTVPVIESVTVSIPSIELQLRISAQLSEIDSKIAVNRRICENLEAQALFKHWFIDFAPFKNGQFVESELGMIPEGWRVGTLEELCSFISRGLSPKYQFGTNELVLGQTCVRNNIVTLNNAREHLPKENSNKYVKKWDVLLNSTGIGSLGRFGVVYFDKTNVCFDSHLTVVRTKEDIYRYYVGRNLLNRQKELENMAVGSTGQTELPKKDVLVMSILIPNSDVLPEFNEIIENIGNCIYTLIEENLRLSTLRDTLLPKLMSGQIKV